MAVQTDAQESQVRTEIREFLMQYAAGYRLSDDDDIFALGLVNSLVALDIIQFIEERYRTIIGNDQIEVANFASVNAIVGLISRLAAGGADFVG